MIYDTPTCPYTLYQKKLSIKEEILYLLYISPIYTIEPQLNKHARKKNIRMHKTNAILYRKFIPQVVMASTSALSPLELLSSINQPIALA